MTFVVIAGRAGVVRRAGDALDAVLCKVHTTDIGLLLLADKVRGSHRIVRTSGPGKENSRMTMKNMLASAVALLSLVGITTRADAATVYNFTSGSITLSANLGGTDLLPPGQQVPLTGTQVTFDGTSLNLTSFQFMDSGSTSAALSGLLTGTTITVSGLNIVPGTGYGALSPTTGTDPYFFTVGPVAASGTYALSGAITRAATAFAGANPVLSGQITTSSTMGGPDSLDLNGITLGIFNVTVSGVTQKVTLKGDIVFNGVTPVPLPAGVWLLGSGLGLLGVPFMRRRRVALSDAR